MASALAAACALAACGGASREVAQPAPAHAAPEHGGVVRVDAAVVERVRADSTRNPYTEADTHFMSAMIGHHAQAIVMAGWAPTHSASPAVRTLAERIVNGQQDEIATMQRWLGERRQPIPDVPTSGMTVSHAGQHDMALMPGMLTDAQITELEQTKGPGFDRLFLTSMIRHHQGAVAMVKALFGTYGAAQDETVFKFANDVSVDQSTEIARMESMLAASSLERASP
ncbi:MAG: DUF305 domain-containing protein [Gemmatimonadales bacterium]